MCSSCPSWAPASWSCTWGSSGCKGSRNPTEVDHGDRARQRENHGRDAGLPPAIWSREVRPPARDPLLPAGDGAGLRPDLAVGGHPLLSLRRRHAVPWLCSEPAVLVSDILCLVSQFLI